MLFGQPDKTGRFNTSDTGKAGMSSYERAWRGDGGTRIKASAPNLTDFKTSDQKSYLMTTVNAGAVQGHADTSPLDGRAPLGAAAFVSCISPNVVTTM